MRTLTHRSGNTVYYLLSDHLGSTSTLLTSAGALHQELRYTPFGEIRQPAPLGSLATDYTFTGQIRDDSGLLFLQARYYDLPLSRFLSADTIVPQPANPQSLNRFSYVNNNPIRYSDPTGHCIGPLLAACLIAVPFIPLAAALMIVADIPGESRAYEGGGALTAVGTSMILGGSQAGRMIQNVGDCLSGNFCDPSAMLADFYVPAAASYGEGAQALTQDQMEAIGSSPRVGDFTGLEGSSPTEALSRVPTDWSVGMQ